MYLLNKEIRARYAFYVQFDRLLTEHRIPFPTKVPQLKVEHPLNSVF